VEEIRELEPEGFQFGLDEQHVGARARKGTR
jgi:hypothetical protein